MSMTYNNQDALFGVLLDIVFFKMRRWIPGPINLKQEHNEVIKINFDIYTLG